MRVRPDQRDLFGRRAPAQTGGTALAVVPPAEAWRRALRRRLPTLVLVMAVSVAVAVGASWALQPVYRASASVEALNPAPTAQFGGASPPSQNLVDAAQLQTMAEQMGSRALVGEALHGLGPAGPETLLTEWRRPRWPQRWIAPARPGGAEAIERTLRQLEIAAVPQSDLIQLQFLAPRPELAVAFLRQLVAAYVGDAQARERAATRQRVEALAAQAAAVGQQTQRAAVELHQLASAHGLADPAAQLTLSVQRWQQLAAATTTAEISGLDQADALAVQAVPDAASSPPGSAPVDLEVQRAAAAAQVSRLAEQYRPEAAPLRQAREQLASLDASLAVLRAQAREQRQHALDAVRRQAHDLDAALAAQARRQASLQQVVDAFDLQQRQLQANQAVYSSLLEQLQQAAAEGGDAPPPLRVSDPPAAQWNPVRPDPRTAVAYALVLGCALGMAAVAWRERSDDGLRLPEAEEVGVPLLAQLPPLARPRRRRGATPVPAGWSPHPPAEFRRGLEACVAALLLAQTEAGVRVIHVASADGGDGRTTLALQVARLLAAVAPAVLLVDGDARRPAVHHALGGPLQPGLAELLAGRAPIEAALHREHGAEPGEVPGLWWVAAGGAAAVQPGFALSMASGALAELLAAARARYDWVVVDGGPIFAGPEAGIWASLADCSLVVAQRGRTSRRRLRRGLDVLESSGAAHIALVLNRAPEAQRWEATTTWLARGGAAEAPVMQMRQRA